MTIRVANYWPEARLIVPVSDADEIMVWRLRERSTMMLPAVPANRPLPPVTVWVSTTAKAGNVTTPCPMRVVKISSPLAAVQVAVPDALGGGLVTVNSEVNVNRPRWVASPVPTR